MGHRLSLEHELWHSGSWHPYYLEVLGWTSAVQGLGLQINPIMAWELLNQKLKLIRQPQMSCEQVRFVRGGTAKIQIQPLLSPQLQHRWVHRVRLGTMPALTPTTLRVFAHHQGGHQSKNVQQGMSNHLSPRDLGLVSEDHCLYDAGWDCLDLGRSLNRCTPDPHCSNLNEVAVNKERLWVCCTDQGHPLRCNRKRGVGNLNSINHKQGQRTRRQGMARLQIRLNHSNRHHSNASSRRTDLRQTDLGQWKAFNTLENSMVKTEQSRINTNRLLTTSFAFAFGTPPLFVLLIANWVFTGPQGNLGLEFRGLHQHERWSELIS